MLLSICLNQPDTNIKALGIKHGLSQVKLGPMVFSVRRADRPSRLDIVIEGIFSEPRFVGLLMVRCRRIECKVASTRKILRLGNLKTDFGQNKVSVLDAARSFGW